MYITSRDSMFLLSPDPSLFVIMPWSCKKTLLSARFAETIFLRLVSHTALLTARPRGVRSVVSKTMLGCAL